jgi:hypothetical protein
VLGYLVLNQLQDIGVAYIVESGWEHLVPQAKRIRTTVRLVPVLGFDLDKDLATLDRVLVAKDG